MDWLNRALGWLTGYHVYDRGYVWEIFPKCKQCGRGLDERCTGWPAAPAAGGEGEK